MSKNLCLGNSELLIIFDEFGQVRDCYYPYVGLENHTKAELVHKMGVWVDDKFSWFDDGSWKVTIDYQNLSMASNIEAVNFELGIKVDFCDVVLKQKNCLVREIKITNQSLGKREIKLFINQQFSMGEVERGDTAIYDHQNQVLIHYKGSRAVLIDARDELNQKFNDYSIGVFASEGLEGTFRDAEDGKLEKNNITHDKVDSVIGLYHNYKTNESKTYWYNLVFEKSIFRAIALNSYIQDHTLEKLVQKTKTYWSSWLEKKEINLDKVDQKYLPLFNKSLLIIQTHIGKNGSVIASGDSDMLKMGRSSYSYTWPRDGSLIISALVKLGYYNQARRFFQFCEQVISAQGYMYHKYRPDMTLGSSWHPWARGLQSELPIQEDETALVIISLWEYYHYSRDLEFVESVYDSLILKSAEFMKSFIDSRTGLPKASYDIWEEKYGTSTFAAAATYNALKSASRFAEILGDKLKSREYFAIAQKLKDSIIQNLYNPKTKFFDKLVTSETGNLHRDTTVDISSLYGILEFGILEVKDPRILDCLQIIEKELVIKEVIGGVARYQNDNYFRLTDKITGNPWVITSLWLASFYLSKAENKSELDPVYKWLDWTVGVAQKSGILAEQINPFNAKGISATPLIWSQAEYVKIIYKLSQKLENFNF